MVYNQLFRIVIHVETDKLWSYSNLKDTPRYYLYPHKVRKCNKFESKVCTHFQTFIKSPESHIIITEQIASHSLLS